MPFAADGLPPMENIDPWLAGDPMFFISKICPGMDFLYILDHSIDLINLILSLVEVEFLHFASFFLKLKFFPIVIFWLYLTFSGDNQSHFTW